jgi:large subunit ribosomal protein L30
MATMLSVKQYRSAIKSNKIQKLNIIALGLGKINREVLLSDSPTVHGQLEKIKHLVIITKIEVSTMPPAAAI